MTKPNVIAPIVNLNGTSKRELLNQLQNAAQAVNAAYKALQEAAPHGRDYQTAPEGTYYKAREQYNVWMDKLDDVYQGLAAIANQIWEQERN